MHQILPYYACLIRLKEKKKEMLLIKSLRLFTNRNSLNDTESKIKNLIQSVRAVGASEGRRERDSLSTLGSFTTTAWPSD